MLEELVVTSLATADAFAKLIIEEGLITQKEFMELLKYRRRDMLLGRFSRPEFGLFESTGSSITEMRAS